MRNPVTKVTLALLLGVIALGFTARAQKAELVVQAGHVDSVWSLAFSPDGKLLASGSSDNTIKLWDAESGKELRTFRGHDEAVRSVAFSPDGKTLASGSNDNTIRLWDVENGKLLRTLEGHSAQVIAVSFSQDGKTLASGGGGYEIRLWSVESGKELRNFKGDSDSLVISMSFSRDGQTLATGSDSDTIKLWDLATGRLLRTLEGPSDSNSPAGPVKAVKSLSFSPDGKTLASGNGKNTAVVFMDMLYLLGTSKTISKPQDMRIRLWDLESGTLLKTLEGHPSDVEIVSFSPDGRTLASGGDDNTIRLWDVGSGKLLRSLTGHASSINGVAFSLEGKILASGSVDKTIRLWDVESGKELKTFPNFSSEVETFSFSPDGKRLASGSGTVFGEEDTIRVWDLSGKGLQTLKGHSGVVRSVAFSPDGKTLASGSQDKTVKLWDAESGNLLRTFVGHKHIILSVAFSPDGTILASGSSDKTVKLWDVKSGKLFRTLRDADSVYSVAFSPDGGLIASGSQGTPAKLWDVRSGRLLRTFKHNSYFVFSVAFSPDGKILAGVTNKSLGGPEENVKLWDIASGKPLRAFDGGFWSVAFSPDGSTLAGGSYDNIIKLWDVKSGKTLKTLTGHSSRVNAVSFTPDGRRLISGSGDRRMKVWDVAAGEELLSLIALNKNDWAVFTPDGLFDASPSARKLMHYVVGLETISLEQMKDVYYVPGLLQNVFKGEPLPKVELFAKQDLFPSVEYEPLGPNQKELTVKLANRGGGIGQVQVLFNGKELIADARPAGFDPSSPGALITIDLSKAPVKAGAENRVEVVARNAAGSLSTRGTEEAEVVYRDASQGLADKPHIYAIVGGISDYTGDKLKLSFAAKDAADFARALELGAIKLFDGDKSRVHVRLLTSAGDKPGTRFSSPDAKISSATKADFTRAFTDFRNAAPKDVFIVYLAGHGISLNLNQNLSQAGGDTYLYLTQEATTTDKSVLAVGNSREAMAISSDELKDLMKQNKALKQVLILDTCAAGALSNSLVGKRDLPSDQIRAIERLKDNTGFFVLMGASADAVSYEASQYGQGLLTYSLLQGMKGARLRENQFADVAMLFGYAQDAVPQMAKNIGGTQRPLIITPDSSNSFDIGQFTMAEQKQIVLPSPKPLILRPTLLNGKLKFDNLQITPLLKQAFQNASFGPRGVQPRADLVFIDADEMVDAVLPSGTYEAEGDALRVTIVLVLNNEPLKSLTFSGRIQDKSVLVDRIVKSVSEETAKLKTLTPAQN